MLAYRDQTSPPLFATYLRAVRTIYCMKAAKLAALRELNKVIVVTQKAQT